MATSVRRIGITEGVIWKEMLRFSAPLLLGNLFQQLYNTVDSIVVGRFVGTNALAAVSSGMYVIFMIIGFIMGISNGSGIILAQRYGARDSEGTQKTVHTAITAMFIGGIIIAIIGFFASPIIIRLIDTPEEVVADAVLYMRIFFSGGMVLVLYNICAGLLQAVGDSRRPLIYLIIATLSNIVLDVLFVVVFKWGVAGVAIATVTAQLLSAILALRALMTDDDIYKVEFRKLGIDKDALRKILTVGLPTGIQQTIISFSNLIVQKYINAFGAAAIAGIGSYNKIDAFVVMPMMSLNLAATTFVGQNIGAKKFDRVKSTVKTVFVLGQTTTLVLSVIIVLVCRLLLGIFTTDASAIEYGIRYMWFMAPFYFLLCIMQNGAAIIRGSGQTLVPMFIMIGVNCVFRVIYLLVVNSFSHTIEATLSCYPITWAISALLMCIYLWKGKWLKVYLKEEY